MEMEAMRGKKEKGSSSLDKSLNSKKRACQECKKAKKKCFGGHPCERCVRRGMEELCLFPEPTPVISFMPYNSPASSSASSSSFSSKTSSKTAITTAIAPPSSYSPHTFNLSSPLPTPPAPSPVPSHFPSLYDLPRFSPISPPGSASLSPLSQTMSQSPSPSPTSLSSLSSPSSLYHSSSPFHSLSLSPSSPSSSSSSAHNSPHALPSSQFHGGPLPSFPSTQSNTYHSQSTAPQLLHPLPQLHQHQHQQHTDVHHPLPYVFPQSTPSSAGCQLPSLSSLSLPSPSVFPAQTMATSPEELRPSLFTSSSLIPAKAHKKRRSALNALCPRRFFRPENKNPVGPGS
eukprot:TRINITY_DN14320_c0_g1_i1.p1 TRINITY_DN14320_c0_g1~~TRINITY_DN14320_c0_g1_i1.p1  ORF type:complete len:357 (+),score=69.31 TRINITY_DN14320_c0_g1_i1:42-1073(+)